MKNGNACTARISKYNYFRLSNFFIEKWNQFNRHYLHGALLGDSFARGGAAEVEGIAAPGGAVLGRGTGTE